MRVTRGELVCFNSMIDKRNIFGVSLRAERVTKNYVQDTLEELKKHEFLDKDGKLNKSYVTAVTMLKEYKNAQSYILLNSYRIAVLEDHSYIIILHKVGKEYELSVENKGIFFKALVEKDSVLTTPTEESEYNTSKVAVKEWMDSIKGIEMDHILWVQSVSNRNATLPVILYRTNGRRYLYDTKKESLLEEDVISMQLILAKYFGIPTQGE